MNERTVARLAGWFLLATVAYFAWHLWLAYGAHQTPNQFFESIARALPG